MWSWDVCCWVSAWIAWGQKEGPEELSLPPNPHGTLSNAVGAPPLLGKSNFQAECNNSSPSSLKILLLPWVAVGTAQPRPGPGELSSSAFSFTWSVFPISFLGYEYSRSSCSS